MKTNFSRVTPILVPVKDDARSRKAARAEVQRRQQELAQMRLDLLKGAGLVLAALFFLVGGLSVLTWL